ncbi:nidogen-2-like [Lytechinus variegatus]|uniref:nidogen-2-like n=1 Tax=Lytechinus variegatus TaxID=7654 RepID=UPI001BB2CE1E|nr:nidogen-2-like [Lytechinus variegatus]
MPVVYNCPGNINQSVKVGYDGIEVFWISPSVSNPSGTPTFVPNIGPGSFFNVTDEPVEVIYTIADGTGWVDESCSFLVSVYYKPSRKIFVTDHGRMFMADLDDLVFNEIPSSGDPYFVTYDDVDKRLYWSDWTNRRVYRSDWKGGNMEEVTAPNAISEPNGVAIARNARRLYVAYRKGDRITSMSIRDGSPFPATETDVADSLFLPRALTVDEVQGYLYWTSVKMVFRAALDGTGIYQVVENPTSANFDDAITSLNIDLTRNPRRVFFSISKTGKNFYKDVLPNGHYTNCTMIINVQMRDVSVINDDLYFLKEYEPIGIAVVKNYDNVHRDYYLIEIDQFENPYQLHIAYIEP